MNKKAVVIGISAAAIIIVALIFWGIVSKYARGTGIPGASTGSRAQKTMTAAEEDAAIRKAEDLLAVSADSPKAEEAYLILGSVYENRREFEKAKDAYQKLVEKFPASNNVQKAQEAIGNTNVKMLFSSEPTPYTTIYAVQKGDNLTKIARKLNTTTELVMKVNGLKSPALQIGRKLRVPKVKFSIAVDKSQNILTLKADGDIFKTYEVSTGKNNSTPVGTFKIINKIVDPPWYRKNAKMVPSGDPNNCLGSRWMGISKPSYGIHGTIDPGSIGKSVTEGCVRMRNPDAEELYAIVPEGTEVIIAD